MIPDLILGWLFGMLDWLLGLLPEWDPIDVTAPVAAITSFGSVLFGLVGWADWYMPAKLTLTLLSMIYVLQAAAFGWRALLWVLRILHITGED